MASYNIRISSARVIEASIQISRCSTVCAASAHRDEIRLRSRPVQRLHVLVDGRPTRSCQETVAGTQGKSVVTLEGLGSISAPHPVQAAFIKEQVPQCGYCTSGMIMSAAALLAEKPKPTEEDVRSALDGNLCRCGTHVRVMRAVMTASGQGG
jgi:aerobic-type carbon monoxide dehydrogenase small subunit (CoxS/CutS family)